MFLPFWWIWVFLWVLMKLKVLAKGTDKGIGGSMHWDMLQMAGQKLSNEKARLEACPARWDTLASSHRDKKLWLEEPLAATKTHTHVCTFNEKVKLKRERLFKQNSWHVCKFSQTCKSFFSCNKKSREKAKMPVVPSQCHCLACGVKGASPSSTKEQKVTNTQIWRTQEQRTETHFKAAL